jgi:hypothetical protein
MTYRGFRFSETQDLKGNHHYVEFDVGDNPYRCKWQLVKKPAIVLKADVWDVGPNGYVWAGFKWADFMPVIGISPWDFEIAPL